MAAEAASKLSLWAAALCKSRAAEPPPDARGIVLNIMWLRRIVAKELVPLRGLKPLPSEQGRGCLERVQDTAARHIRLKLAYNMLREVGISALDRRQAVSPRGPKRRGCMQPG